MKKIWMAISFIGILSFSYVGITIIDSPKVVEAAGYSGNIKRDLGASYFNQSKDSRYYKKAVKVIQNNYNAWLFNTHSYSYYNNHKLNVDGYFGSKTTQAVKVFQSYVKKYWDRNLAVDGSVGQHTWHYLYWQ
ncbi:peptidoglycan-binding protein [Listeria sp. ILCC797]|uniref:peptidoglycan-binding domain-containing protein n=1 Tax=Listeria sp. ILCC797 TaxID=1918333 RepID=UPI000B58F090|nr:peptidoglycan-binding domain-containing protein [Listeria sp. ILCC797]